MAVDLDRKGCPFAVDLFNHLKNIRHVNPTMSFLCRCLLLLHTWVCMDRTVGWLGLEAGPWS
jgi:hypothetical protein